MWVLSVSVDAVRRGQMDGGWIGLSVCRSSGGMAFGSGMNSYAMKPAHKASRYA